MTSLWLVAAPKDRAKEQSKSASARASAMVEFDASGAVSNFEAVLGAKGIKTDGYVVRAADQVRFRVKTISEQDVQLEDNAGVVISVRPSAGL